MARAPRGGDDAEVNGKSISRADRLRGGIYGLLVGDALGVPYEFRAARDLPAAIAMVPPAGFDRAHASVPPGTWSDDGAQALALLASLLDGDGRFDADDFGRRLVAWSEHGEFAVGGVVFDIGITTARAIRALRSGTPALQAGPSGVSDNGNGALMRVLPVALVCRGDDRELVAMAMASSRVTHGHARSQVCCALYCLWARAILAGDAAPWRAAVARLRALLAPGSVERAELEDHVQPDAALDGRGSGYVLDSLRSARMCCDRHDRYEGAVIAAVRLGDDTDTTAAITGGIAGVRDGIQAIPTEWLAALRGRDLVDPLVDRLLARG